MRYTIHNRTPFFSLKKMLGMLLLFVIISTTFVNILYAQEPTPANYIPLQWRYSYACEYDINAKISVTGIKFKAGPYATTIFAKRSRNFNSSSSQKEEKLTKFEILGAKFQHSSSYGSSIKNSYTFTSNDIAPFIIEGGQVYRAKRVHDYSAGESVVRDSVLRMKRGTIARNAINFAKNAIDHYGDAYTRKSSSFADRLLYVSGLSSKHNRVIGHGLPLSVNELSDDGRWGFTRWDGSQVVMDYALVTHPVEACLVHYYPENPNDIQWDGKVKVDKVWIQGHRDDSNRWRFIFLVLNHTDKDIYNFYQEPW
ncbi:MAG: hypothetical protein OXC44_07330 [Proteobacteria bacterium]|nr:hypothetical protein [Pseudomonadota bacterium]